MNYSRAVGVARFVLVILVIAIFMTLAVCGFESWGLGGVFDKGTIVLGLDLQGGSVITLSASADEAVTSVGMKSVETLIRGRLDRANLTEANCYLVGDNMITIEIPGDSDPNAAIEQFAFTGSLTFRTYNDETESYDIVILTGDDVDDAVAMQQQDETGAVENVVALKFNEKGTKIFADATAVAAAQGSSSPKNCIAIYMDDTLLSQPSVQTAITGGDAVISSSNGMTTEYAISLADNIKAGSLAYKLVEESILTVGPTLGEKSLTTSLKAGAIGILLVMVFMIAVYRVPGLMSTIALIAYMAIFLLVLNITGANLTLPGIAGIVLSIGMAVDANVVIFERMKEELRNGKSAKAAIKSGYSKAFSAILDSNVTTLIAAGVLYFLGSGTIQGFAVTLAFGVIISFFTALVVTRILLNLGCAMGWTKLSLYCSAERSATNE